MTDTQTDAKARLTQLLHQVRCDYWEKLTDAEDPQADDKHQIFSAHVDELARRLSGSTATLGQEELNVLNELSQIVVACRHGDERRAVELLDKAEASDV